MENQMQISQTQFLKGKIVAGVTSEMSWVGELIKDISPTLRTSLHYHGVNMCRYATFSNCDLFLSYSFYDFSQMEVSLVREYQTR
jgi:hypothetical protein